MKTLLLITLLSLTIISINTQAADEGIKVHGHWKFEIYNPDGSFDRKVEFENALTSTGVISLLEFLNKDYSVGVWSIVIDSSNTTTNSNFCKDSATLVECVITEPNNSGNYSNIFKNLTYSLDLVSNPNKLILSGNFTTAQGIPANSAISRVTTYISKCNSSLTPNCMTGFSFITDQPFTQKIFSGTTNDPIIPVISDQLIKATVEISFS